MISINSPPSDKRCECCRYPSTELKPYPNGALLFKTFREQSGCISASWECSDCVGLNDEEWFRRRYKDELTTTVREKIKMIKECK